MPRETAARDGARPTRQRHSLDNSEIITDPESARRAALAGDMTPGVTVSIRQVTGRAAKDSANDGKVVVEIDYGRGEGRSANNRRFWINLLAVNRAKGRIPSQR